jgi:hypothetical protein
LNANQLLRSLEQPSSDSLTRAAMHGPLSPADALRLFGFKQSVRA